MYSLERITLCNWGRLDPQDIELRGSVAILGPTGAGKSTIVDALQVVLTGASSRFYDLNKSTGGTNTRTVRDYCLGCDDNISDKPARPVAETLLGLCFRDTITGRAVSIGVMFYAALDETTTRPSSLFVAPDFALSLDQLVATNAEGRSVLLSNAAILDKIKSICPGLRTHSSSIRFVDDYLIAMRPRGAAPDAGQVMRNLKQAIAFQPIDDPTEFVRRHILEEDHIDVGALKESIGRYKYLEAEVKSRELQLKEIGAARSRFETWAGHSVKRNALRFLAAHADRLRLEIAIARTQEQRASIAAAREREESAKKGRENMIQTAEESVVRQAEALAQAPEAQKIRLLEAERKTIEERRRNFHVAVLERTKRLRQLAVAAQKLHDKLPIRLKDGLIAAGEFVAMIQGKNLETLAAYDAELAEVERRIMTLLEAETSLQQQQDALVTEIAKNRETLTELEGRTAVSQGGPTLSFPTIQLIGVLRTEGIEAVPLPSVVEVTDQSWAMALEMLLGAGREALIVSPSRVRDAFSILFRERQRFHGCRLVDTRKTSSWRSNLPSGSIAEIIDAETDDARVYIERQVGRYLRAETDADLERFDQAITRRGKMTASASLRVYRDLVPILGKVAQARAADLAQQQLAELSARQSKAMADRDAIGGAIQAIKTLREQSPTALTEAVTDLVTCAASLRDIENALLSVASPEGQRLQQVLQDTKDEIAAWRKEIRTEIEPRIKELDKEDVGLQVTLRTHESDLGARKDEEAAAEAAEQNEPLSKMIELLSSPEIIAAQRVKVSVLVELTPGERDPTARLYKAATEAKAELDPLRKNADESASRGQRMFFQFVNDHMNGTPPPDTSNLALLKWCQDRERTLELDELIRFREQFENARVKMEEDLTEGLINRLSDKFAKAKSQIERLNRNLSGRTFTGQSYAFRYRVNESMRPIHILADAIADDPQRGLQMLKEKDVDPRVRKGFDELSRRLDDDQLVKDLQDYRRFFDFDLEMTNERNQTTTLSKRSGTGSGGQKQAPYYVAVGAAMAAAYFPKSGAADPDGVGLVVFDEAFNNLDAPNTKALLDFFSSMRLQVIVAAPDKVRAMFLETADTVVSINRRPDTLEPVATVTYPTVLARRELSKANPVNAGVESFRTAGRQAAE